jgi:hypothetical protein
MVGRIEIDDASTDVNESMYYHAACPSESICWHVSFLCLLKYIDAHCSQVALAGEVSHCAHYIVLLPGFTINSIASQSFDFRIQPSHSPGLN